jgi:hypothetical protein
VAPAIAAMEAQTTRRLDFFIEILPTDDCD